MPPQRVCRIALMACAKAEEPKYTMNSIPELKCLDRAQAENARAWQVSTMIHTQEPKKTPTAMLRLSHIQERPLKLPSSANSSNPGIQVMRDSRIPSTEALPSTYSRRENGRDKYNGMALLATSGATRLGPPKAATNNAWGKSA